MKTKKLMKIHGADVEDIDDVELQYNLPKLGAAC